MASCVSLLRCLVFITNLLFWIFGVISVGLGLWLLFDPSAASFFSLHSANEDSYRAVGWLMLAAGLVITLLGCCGCCGAWKRSQGGLVGFFAILVLVFCLQLAAAVVAYNKQENIARFVETSIYDTIRNRYANDDKHKAALDYIQTSFECCGAKSYQDWLQASWDRRTKVSDDPAKLEHGIGAVGGGRGNGYGKVPSSCCNELGRQNYPLECGESFNTHPLESYAAFLHEKGCTSAVHDWVYAHLDAAIVVCVIAAIIQLVAMALSMILCCCFNAEEKKYDDY